MSRPLTVVQMLPALEGGGVERGTLEVARELVRKGHRSIVIARHGRLVEQLISEGSEHLDWDVGRKHIWTLRYVPRLRRFLADNQADILHLRSRLPAWIGYWAWKKLPSDARPGLVTTVHGLYSVKRYSSIMTRGERVIAVSNTVRDYITHNYPSVDQGTIRVIPRGVDAAEFPFGWQPDGHWLANWYAQFPQMRDRQLITLPGRLTRLKGHLDFVDLIAQLRAQKKNVHGVIVGGVDPRRHAYAQEVRAKVHQLNLDADITLTGARPDMREVFAVSDLVLSLSGKPESFGRTVLEALSMGRPVAGYAHGGVGEILSQVYPSGCVSLNDSQSLLDTVSQLLSDPPPVPDHHPYSLQPMLDNTLAVYQELTE